MSYTCMARLLASAVHDMRNILAVIRESAGLAQDLTSLDSTGPVQEDHKKELASSLDEVRRQVLLAAQLAEGLEFMAQADMVEGAASCDLARVCRLFCRMATRHARATQIRLQSSEHEEPVWAAVSPLDVLQALLDILDVCIAVGGRVDLSFTAARRLHDEYVEVRVSGGENTALALSALTGNPLQDKSCQCLLRPGSEAGTFILVWRSKEVA